MTGEYARPPSRENARMAENETSPTTDGAPTTGDPRPLRYCDLCGGLDDHPRHVRSLGRGEPDHKHDPAFLDGLPDGPRSALAQLLNGRVRVAHMDCCAAAGCPICAVTEVENDRRRGTVLVDHLAASREG